MTETRWLSEPEQHYWRAFLAGSAGLTEALNRDLEQAAGLSLNEYEVLVRLSESPDRRVRMSALAQSLVHSRSRLTHTIGRMERRGFVDRAQCSTDGRGVDAILTDAGFAMLKEVAPAHVQSVRTNFVDLLTPEEFETVGRAFAAVARAQGMTGAGVDNLTGPGVSSA